MQKIEVFTMKRLVSIQDISCIGKCSQTIALPVISAMGIETSIIPTAVLSAHTMFPGYTFCDLSDNIIPVMEHWKTLDIRFDAILSGYLGSISHIGMLLDFYDTFADSDTITIADPVFADNGKIYAGFDEAYAKAVASISRKAMYILPNITEASIMARLDYRTDYDMDYICEIFDRLTADGASNIIITSVIRGDDNGIVARFADGSTFEYFKPDIKGVFHGTGDLFASTFSGALLNGFSAKDAARIAVDYTSHTLKATIENKNHNWYGIDFEDTIPYLLRLIGKI